MKKKRYTKSARNGRLIGILAVIVCIVAVLLSAFWQKDGTSHSDLAVHFIDVGQGDAILVQAPSGETMLIDAGSGSSEEDLLSYLEQMDVSVVDYFVLTHPDEDHIGGADRVFAEYIVSTVMMPDCEKDTNAYKALQEAIEEEDCHKTEPISGNKFSFCEGGTVTVLAPNAESYAETNDYSVVLRLDYYETSFLFTGDAGIESEKEMMLEFSEKQLDCDVLKVGHHGSYTATSKEFLDAVTPEIAVISCGKDNTYGHPHAQVKKRLEKSQVTVYRTDKEGSICLYSDGNCVKTEADT